MSAKIQADTHTSTSEECKHCPVLENRLSDAEKRLSGAEKRLSDAEKKLVDMQQALEKEEVRRKEQDEMLEMLTSRLTEVERKEISEDSASYHSMYQLHTEIQIGVQ